MGELPAGGRVLGCGSLWRCSNEVCRTRGGCNGSDIGDVFAAIFSSVIEWLDWREAEEGAQEDGVRSYQHQASEDIGRDCGNVEGFYIAM